MKISIQSVPQSWYNYIRVEMLDLSFDIEYDSSVDMFAIETFIDFLNEKSGNNGYLITSIAAEEVKSDFVSVVR